MDPKIQHQSHQSKAGRRIGIQCRGKETVTEWQEKGEVGKAPVGHTKKRTEGKQRDNVTKQRSGLKQIDSVRKTTKCVLCDGERRYKKNGGKLSAQKKINGRLKEKQRETSMDKAHTH